MVILQSKKGQGLSLNVIIVAALALIVLVVLAAIFVGRIGVFAEGVNKPGQEQLAQIKSIDYGSCHPDNGAERAFLRGMDVADEDLDAQDLAYDDLIQKVRDCKAEGADQSTCESASGCAWG